MVSPRGNGGVTRMTQKFFGRNIEVLVGPLQEYKGGGDPSQALKFFANGAADQFRIKFTIPKHVISTALPTKVDIYNLSQDTRNFLRESELQVIVNVGWINDSFRQVFKGSLMNTVHVREGADIVSSLLCLAGFGATSRATISRTWNSGVFIKTIVNELAELLPGITINQNSIKINSSFKLGSQGWSTVGTIQDSLDKLARTYGFSWWIDSGIFQALDDEEGFQGNQLIVSTENGLLLRAEPMLASPLQVKTGVSIITFLHPPLEPGKLVQLKSKLNPNLDGEYKIHTVNHTGDSHSDSWLSKVQSWVVV